MEESPYITGKYKNVELANMTIHNFINYILMFDNVDDILNNCRTQSDKDYAFERLYDIVIKFGFCDVFPNSKYNHIIGNSNVFNISVQFKMSLQSLIDNPKELLELINDCLKPKDVEKKQYGEVFTPMKIINEMLNDIESHWKAKTNLDIWENENLTWYDPAAGMGNYPIAIYYKLMNGLKYKFPNETDRKKHIIEKQLFMGELNKKNCFIIKQIFNINDEYNLNLYEGNTLDISINKIFKQNKFNIIVGNPPYNEELTSIGAKPLYNK